MLHDMPMTQNQIRTKLGKDKDCYQLLTLEGDDFTQIKGITHIANTMIEKVPELDLFISSNAHDFGTYYGLEIDDSQLEKYNAEELSLIVVEELGYDI